MQVIFLMDSVFLKNKNSAISEFYIVLNPTTPSEALMTWGGMTNS